MIKIESNVTKQELEKRIDKVGDSVLHFLGEGITKRAKSNFRRAIRVTGADISRSGVEVYNTYTSNTVTITCVGEQVLFQEFGAGVNNAYKRTVDYTKDDPVTFWTGEDYYKNGNPKIRFANNTWSFGATGETETLLFGLASRPAGIVGLGGYGKHQGMNDIWVRPSMDGIPNLDAGESHVHKKNGEIREGYVWTYGTPPTRSLYRAVVNSIKALEKEINGK